MLGFRLRSWLALAGSDVGAGPQFVCTPNSNLVAALELAEHLNQRPGRQPGSYVDPLCLPPTDANDETSIGGGTDARARHEE